MKKILISIAEWETRAAIIRNNTLQNVFFASHSIHNLERCFFIGIVTKILPGIQTAFVDIGQDKSGFLHISEIDRDLAISRMSDTVAIEDQETPKEPIKKSSLDISKILKENEPVLVQVSKEPIYEKGAKLTTCFTLPGRFIVLMPNIPRIGISKKIENKEERHRLKEIVKSFLPKGMGAIIRTSSENRTSKELSKDIAFLVRTWNAIFSKFQKGKNARKVELIHEDLPLTLQVVRDNLDDDVEEVIIDDKETLNKVHRFVKGIAPEYTTRIKFWPGPISLFDYYDVNKQIEDALRKKVHLKSGGSIIIETTEAMTVIDVNTGKYIGKSNLEDTILQTNLEAAQEVVRQLRLRNIGGLIVIDFIDMSSQANRQKLFKFFEQTLKEQDKFQSVVLKVSEFGLLQMTRKRSGKTLIQQLMETCNKCHGLGFVKSLRTQCYSILQKVQEELKVLKSARNIILSVNPAIFDFITTVEYNSILDLEKKFNCRITLLSKENIEPSAYKLEIQQ
jgi:ribonuclease G